VHEDGVARDDEHDEDLGLWDSVPGLEGGPLEGADDDHEHDADEGGHGDRLDEGARKRMKTSRAVAAVMPLSLPRPPDFTLMRDWPIMAQPPMPPKTPQVMLATPCPTHSRLPTPRVSVSSSMRVMVMSDSMSPTPARMTEKGRMIQRVSSVAGGRVKSSHAGRGSPPAMPTPSTSTEAMAASISSGR
jgi:hypothetical protein